MCEIIAYSTLSVTALHKDAPAFSRGLRRGLPHRVLGKEVGDVKLMGVVGVELFGAHVNGEFHFLMNLVFDRDNRGL